MLSTSDSTGWPRVLVSATSSDSHTWNLVYLHLLLCELGADVVNLGPCVPDALLIDQSRRRRPDLIVMSSVNGHGFVDGMRLIKRVRACPELAATPVVIGGKLGIDGPDTGLFTHNLLRAGYRAVFDDGRDLDKFRALVRALPARRSPVGAV